MRNWQTKIFCEYTKRLRSGNYEGVQMGNSVGSNIPDLLRPYYILAHYCSGVVSSLINDSSELVLPKMASAGDPVLEVSFKGADAL